MKTKLKGTAALFLAALLAACQLSVIAFAADTGDPEVDAVIAKLEAIDTLQAVRDKKNSYTASGHYDKSTTNTTVINRHLKARQNYDAYATPMLAERAAAQMAYDALSDEQKAMIAPELVQKLAGELPTLFRQETYAITPATDEYTLEAVKGGLGYGYEVANYMVSSEIPQTFVLVDTTGDETSWTPNGLYSPGESNYEVAYCSDVMTPLNYTTDYKRVNLEDNGYYGKNSAGHIRAILQIAYPFVTIDEMKANLKAGGLDPELVDDLNRADLISAVQSAIWTYANVDDNNGEPMQYFATINVAKNTGIYFYPMHDYTNEIVEWLPGTRTRTFDPDPEYRVNTLSYYLCNLEPVEAKEGEIIISDIEVTRADLIPENDGSYNVGMYVQLNHKADEDDDLKITITSTDAEGNVTGHSDQPVAAGVSELQMTVNAKVGNTIKVELTGTQHVDKGAYFYEPRGGRSDSQSLVGVGEGETRIGAREEFIFTEEAGEMGLRIYKTAGGTGAPLSDIPFVVYKVEPEEGEVLEEIPSIGEVQRFAVEENVVARLLTDTTGYASTALEKGIYLVIEEHNPEKVIAPVDPFYITIPMNQKVEKDDGTIVIQETNVVSVYPKNQPPEPPEEPPVVPPPPDRVKGHFDIVKYDEYDRTLLLEGAKFAVYRAASATDTDAEIITCGGREYAVAPVVVNDERLVLVTDESGKASSPDLACGIYYLVEISAPAGYNKLDEAVSVMVLSDATSTVATAEIPNRRGTILPETGAEGTKWMMTIGMILIFGSAIVLVARKLMSVYE